MTPANVRALVDRGLEIREQLTVLKKELDQIENTLEAAALDGDHEELKDADRDGRRFLARGSKLVVPVVFTADKLVQTFSANTSLHKKIAEASGRHLQSFYLPSTTYAIVPKDGKAFRKLAVETLGTEKGPELVTACLARDKHGIPKSDVKIGWGDAEDIQA